MYCCTVGLAKLSKVALAYGFELYKYREEGDEFSDVFFDVFCETFSVSGCNHCITHAREARTQKHRSDVEIHKRCSHTLSSN